MTLCALQRFPSQILRSFLEQVGEEDVAQQEVIALVGDSRVSNRSGDFRDGALKLYILTDDVAVAVAGSVDTLRTVLTRFHAEIGTGRREPMELAELLRDVALEEHTAPNSGSAPDCAVLLAARHPMDKTVWGFVLDFTLNPPLQVATDIPIGPPDLRDELQAVLEQIDRDNPNLPIAADQMAIRMMAAVATVARHHPKGVVGIPISCIIMSRDQLGYWPR